MTDNEIREHRDRQLVRRLGDTPDLGAKAVEAIATVAESYDPVDANLFARRLLEAELGAGPEGVGEHVYREAAGTLRAVGHPAEAEALRMIADTSTVLAAASVEWHGRFLARPETQTERDARQLIRDGHVRVPDGVQGALGADGARYIPAVLTVPGGASDPAVIVTTHVGTAEVVTGFRGLGGQTAWLGDRMIHGPGPGRPASTALPLGSCDGGPDCRTAREEQALAGLLGAAIGETGPAELLTGRSFTTCTRAEIYLAWRDARAAAGTHPGIDAVREELARRMLRAPGWAAPFTGWPFADRALGYFDRLTATPVSVAEARAACSAIVAEDAMAVTVVRSAGPALRHQAGRRVSTARPPVRIGGVPLQRPRPDDPSPGFGPRLLTASGRCRAEQLGENRAGSNVTENDIWPLRCRTWPRSLLPADLLLFVVVAPAPDIRGRVVER